MYEIDWSSGQLIVAIIAGVVTTLVGVTTFFWRRMQKRSFIQNEKFQSDSHIFRLCQALSDPSPRLQMAAAALLLERLHSRNSDREQNAVIQALIAATIDDRSDKSQPIASSEFCKYIADSLLEVLKQSKGYGSSQSPLAAYYWQRVRIPGAYWAGADLRGADFFGATLDGASLRRSNLCKTVLYDASLKSVKLLGAELTAADFRGANLCGADLRDHEADEKFPARKTVWTDAKFAGAIYDGGTRFPANFDPMSQGMILVDVQGERLAS